MWDLHLFRCSALCVLAFFPRSQKMHRLLYFFKICQSSILPACRGSLQSRRITSIILSHFILDLRLDPDEHSESIARQSTITFASRIEGNLGAPLNGLWGSAMDESIDQEDARGSGLWICDGHESQWVKPKVCGRITNCNLIFLLLWSYRAPKFPLPKPPSEHTLRKTI